MTRSWAQKLFFCCDQISLQRACRKTVQVLIVIFHDFSIFHRIFEFLSWLEKHWGGIILQKVLRKEAEDEAGHSEWDFRIHGIHGQFFNGQLHIVLGQRQPWTNGPMDSDGFRWIRLSRPWKKLCMGHLGLREESPRSSGRSGRNFEECILTLS